MSKSKTFEKEMYRIKKLIEHPNRDVIWNDRIPDPDNENQLRQIDIRIRDEGFETHVECRIHKTPQNVNWIEELHGRRASLRVDCIIAVSASGFTEGAIKKADKFGIILRDLRVLTEEELMSWGKPTNLAITYFEFYDLKFNLTFQPEYLNEFKDFDPSMISEAMASDISKLTWFHLQKMAQRFYIEYPDRQESPCNALLNPAGRTLCGAPIDEFIITGRMRRRVENLHTVSCVAYDEPRVTTRDRKGFQEKFEYSSFEVTKSSGKVSTIFDASGLQLPANSSLVGWQVDFGKVVTVVNQRVIALPQRHKMDFQFTIAKCRSDEEKKKLPPHPTSDR